MKKLHSVPVFCLFFFVPSYFLNAQNTPAIDTAQARVMFEEVIALWKKKDMAEAIAKMETIQAGLTKSHNQLTLVYADILIFKAFLLMDIKIRKPNEGLKVTDTLLEMYRPVFGDNSEQMASTYQARGQCYRQLAQYSNAVTELMKSYKLRVALTGENSTRDVLGYLTIALAQKGDYEKAVFYTLKCIEVCRKTQGEISLARSSLYSNLAIVYKNMGEYDKSLALHNTTIELKEKYDGLNDVVTH